MVLELRTYLCQITQEGNVNTNHSNPGLDRVSRLAQENQSTITTEFWDELYDGLQKLVSGGAEQVCIDRRARSGPLHVEINQMTTGSTAGGVAGQTPEV